MSISRNIRMILGCLLALGPATFTGCGGGSDDPEVSKSSVGQITFHLEAGFDDVAGFLFEVYQGESLIEQRYGFLEDAYFPSRLKPEVGPEHRFADAFFVLPPGVYRARAIPMISEQLPSRTCREAEQEVQVLPSKTTEVILTSNCERVDNGAVDIVVITNHNPKITNLNFAPSKFILTCQELNVTATVNDEDGDAILVNWEVVEEPGGASFVFQPDGSQLFFMSRVEGDYQVKVVACDTLGLCASLTFPIHVSLSSDADQNGIGDECEERKSSRIVTILLTMSNPRIGNDLIPLELATGSVDWVSPTENPSILVVRDDNNHGEYATDPVVVQEWLLDAGYSADFLDEPLAGLSSADLEGYDVVWFSNPGHPVDDQPTFVALSQFLEDGGGVVLQGDDMTQGEGFSMAPLTHLQFSSNGTRFCGENTDNNAGRNYQVRVEENGHPVIDGYLEGKTFLYGDDIDTSTPLENGEVVLAWATLARQPRAEMVSLGSPSLCECPSTPVVVAFDPFASNP